MKIYQRSSFLGILVLFGLALIAGLLLTGDSAQPAVAHPSPAWGEPNTLVDQRPLQTARKLAALASTPEEQHIVQDLLRIADHAVDLAFADAVREAADHPVQPTPQARELSLRIDKLEAAVKTGQDRLQELASRVETTRGNAQDAVKEQIDLTQAQLALDEDELDDARGDLARTGGDQESRMKRLLDEHRANQHEAEALRFDSAVSASALNHPSANLAARFRAWNALRRKRGRLLQAQQEAENEAATLARSHQTLEEHVRQEEAERRSSASQASALTGNIPREEQLAEKSNTAAAINSLRHSSDDQKRLAGLDKRIQDQQELAAAYRNWITLVQGSQRAAVHGIFQSSLWILLVVLGLCLAERLIDRFFRKLTPDRKRLLTLRVVIRFALQAVGVLLVLFVVFGTPSQMPTILGLAGAGLTVALKDFIVAFFGWFVLMGRNGIRVGDWVEINGVGGEVVEIGLLRTVLMETGNWTESGHPTGRKVAFNNGYAVEGHYFNFSTSGQWLWDELQVLVPASENPYPFIEAIQQMVASGTEADARAAEQEWQHAAGGYRVKSVSAVPTVDVRPTSQGVEVKVRYITRAPERYNVRTRLYQAVVDLLQGKKAPATTLAAAARTSSNP
jgi:small-conductance mechanosensitive channel